MGEKNGNRLSEIADFINLRGEDSQWKREFLFFEGLFISISGSLEYWSSVNNSYWFFP